MRPAGLPASLLTLAHADLPRARALLQTIADKPDSPHFARPDLVPYGLGLMASELAAKDPATARGLLDESFNGLVELSRSTDGRTNPLSSVLIAALLPVVERVDPDRLAERLWLAASCRPTRPQDPNASMISDLAALAMLVSRYDHAAAEAIIAPVLDSVSAVLGQMEQPGHVDAHSASSPRTATRDGALIPRCPPVGAEIETGLLESGNVSVSAELSARLAAAEMLGRPIAERRRAAREQSVYPFKFVRERW